MGHACSTGLIAFLVGAVGGWSRWRFISRQELISHGPGRDDVGGGVSGKGECSTSEARSY